ncbi:MAG: flagellin FliC [Burkholderiales bacterium]|jgi:flagellin|nr:flagellin FliC [Burkholderiales bacterium]MBP7518959.1 flagellin FliC [Leptothrix sp. (in: b-proteobacteria)]
MPQTINTNLASLNAQRNLNGSQGSLATSMQRLSSGLRVNSAKDDAAGLAIAERMNAQSRGMNSAIRNANDGISLAQVAEGALGKSADLLQRMRELAVQSANDTNTDDDRLSLDQEFGELAKEVQRVLGGTTFNGKSVVGSDAGTLTFQIGANTTTADSIVISTTDLTTNGTIVSVAGSDVDGTGRMTIGDSTVDFDAVLNGIDDALDKINSERAVLGATQSRFDAIISNLQIGIENQSAARSRIMDADFAVETANLSRAQVLQQAGNAMVAQANQLPQQVLSLLKG